MVARRARRLVLGLFRRAPKVRFRRCTCSTAATSAQAVSSARGKLELIERRVKLGDGAVRAVLAITSSAGVLRGGGRRIGNLALEVAGDHAQRAAGQIAETVGQVGVEALHEGIEAERAVLAEDDLAQQEVAESVGAERRREWFRCARCCRAISTSCSLRRAASRAPRCDFGSGKLGGEQERRPVDAVEAHDLFADHVHVGGPVTCRTSACPWGRLIRSRWR